MKQVNLGFYRMVLFLLLGLFTSVIAYSQQISVKGIVIVVPLKSKRVL